MMKLKATSVAVALVVAGSAWAAAAVRDEPIKPIEPAKVENAAKVELGKKLWFEPRLSMSGIISCNTCHNLSMGGTDNLKTSIGHGWKAGPVNSPTVYNSSLAIAQFWDGRAADLKEQAGGPIQAGVEMNMPHTLAVGILQSIPGYVEEFESVYGKNKIDIDMITDSIAEFEKTLVTPNSRFDQWLLGKADALNADEKAGYKLFKDSGCIGCHNGPALGGNSYAALGSLEPYTTNDQGRYVVTGNEAEKFVFKVPSLRNVAVTGPYLHDGSIPTMESMVQLMVRHQLGRELTNDEVDTMVVFLRSLTGELPSDYTAEPQLPLDD